MRYAAIDVGSNAVRLLISDVLEKDAIIDFKKVLFVRVPLRLGETVFAEEKISKKKTTQFIKVISAFKNLIDVYQVDGMMACATAAMREASNGREIIRQVKSETGIRIEIIDGKREAEMIYSNHIAETLNNNKDYLYIDVGGGSTELTIFSRGRIVASTSFPLGTIKILFDKVTDLHWQMLKDWLKLNLNGSQGVLGIGTGGNINKIFKLSGKKDNKSLSYQEIKDTYNYLLTLTIQERIEKLGLNEDRADVIVPAARIFLCIMKWSGIEDIYIPRLGLADGIVHYLYEKDHVEQPR